MDNCPKKDCHEKNALIFRKVVIPASVADDRVNPPKNGEYCNQLVVYEASGNAYLFSSDGIPTLLTTDVMELANALDREIDERKEADEDIWDEIETIEASSDVVDVVGTYAELEAYDTSKLKDNDLIKVLADETRDDAITYYRWSTATDTFTYVGAEGPYYTASETDTLLSGKQDTLIAGTNISIASDGKTISATDTTYNAFTGATASVAGTSGLVPAPSAGDEGKVLMGNGTWGEGAANTIFYRNSSETGSTRHLYKSSDMTGIVTMQDILDANEKGQVIVRLSTAAYPENYSDSYLQNAYVGTNDYQMLFLNEKAYESYDTTAPSDSAFLFSRRELQDKLTAGSNITISGNSISATDTTYSNFVGTDGLVAGAAGLVPAPAVADDNKYLKSDGTWATVQGGGGASVTLYYLSDGPDSVAAGNHFPVYKDSALTTEATATEFFNAVMDGEVRLIAYGSVAYYVQYRMDNTDSYGDNGENFYTIWDAVSGKAYDIEWDGSGMARPLMDGVYSYQPTLTAGTNISIGTVLGVPNTISVTGMPVLYGSQGQNTDGAVTQKVFTDTVGDVESILQILNSGAGV